MNFSIRLEESLVDEIDSYAEKKHKNRSDAIRSLIELGLRIENLKDSEEDSVDLSDERDKMLIEIWVGLCKMFTLQKKEITEEEINQLSIVSKNILSKRFIKLYSQYQSIFDKPSKNEDNKVS